LDARETQDSARRANGRFRQLAAAKGWGDAILPFLCECADADCLGRIEMSTSDYGQTHAHDCYVVIRGHPVADGALLADDRAAFLVMANEPPGA
jgi:hypothetical protein